MRKIAIIVAMLAMVLMTAVPAFAQDVVAGDQYSLTVDASISDSFNTDAEAIQVVDQTANLDQTQTTTVVVAGNTAGGDINTAVAANQSAEINQSAVQYANDYFWWGWWGWWW